MGEKEPRLRPFERSNQGHNVDARSQHLGQMSLFGSRLEQPPQTGEKEEEIGVLGKPIECADGKIQYLRLANPPQDGWTFRPEDPPDIAA